MLRTAMTNYTHLWKGLAAGCHSKNIEKAYFNQRLECAAPKRGLKYTTASHVLNIFSCHFFGEKMIFCLGV